MPEVTNYKNINKDKRPSPGSRRTKKKPK